MSGLVNRVIDFIKERRDRVLRGDLNCIPCPFKRFRRYFVGVEQGKMYIVTGQTKASKTQIANYLFIYNSILYAYHHPEKIHLRIFYFPLEETQEAITLRFMSFLLYTISEGRVRVSPMDLKSSDERKPLDPEVIELLESNKYQEILNFFDEHITFAPVRNPTGLYSTAIKYAKTHGTIHYKSIDIKDRNDNVVDHKTVFDYYKADDPNEYVIFFVDHVGLVDTESGLDLYKSIAKLSEYCMVIRNYYNYIPVLIQQQSTETGSLEAFKANKIRPTQAGLADNKATAKDATVLLGITNPYSFELNNYYRYDLTKLGSSARFLEVILNREGESNGLIALYFDGAVNYYTELPAPDDIAGLSKYYALVKERRKTEAIPEGPAVVVEETGKLFEDG